MATAANVIDVSSSSDSDADNVPLRRRMSERKRKLSDKAKETIKEKGPERRTRSTKASKRNNEAAARDDKAEDAAAAVSDGPARVEDGSLAAEEEEEEDVCPICLDPPLHPVELECSHKFCFTCAKGLTNTDSPLTPSCCSLCRAPIPPGFFSRPTLLQRTRSDLASASALEGGLDSWQWFYQARSGGWWKFERRHSEDIEEAFLTGTRSFDTLICGKLYTIDLVNLVQFAKDNPMRRRTIKRDAAMAQSVGVAGLVLK